MYFIHTEFSSLAPVVRLNASALFIFMLRNMSAVTASLAEKAQVDSSTLYDKHQKVVIVACYSFFYISTNAKDVSNMFLIRIDSDFKQATVNSIVMILPITRASPHCGNVGEQNRSMLLLLISVFVINFCIRSFVVFESISVSELFCAFVCCMP